MLVVLLLITQITCEWVEISQNHYKKEPSRNGPQHIVNIDKDITKDFNSFKNVSIIEKQWNKAVIDRVTNAGNIRRVQVPSVKTPSIKERTSDNRFYVNTNQQSLGGINIKQRHEVENSMSQHEKTRTRPNLKPIKYLNEDLAEIKITNFQITQNKNQNEYNKLHNANYHQVINEGHKLVSINESRNKQFTSSSSTSKPKTSDETYIKVDKPIKYQDFQKSDKEDKLKEGPLNNDNFFNTTLTTEPKIHTNTFDNMYSEYSKDYSAEFNLYNSKVPLGLDLNTNFAEITANKENVNKDKDKEGISNSTRSGAVNGMWKLMKIVTDTIYKNTHRSFKSKIKYLEDLKATIITSIEEHIDTVWPDDAEHRSVKRSARSAQERGHLEFPSSESTLMTISFLTFAVFLIKLVLQVIHTYKSKTMMVTPTVVAAVGRAAAALRAKHV